MLQRVSGDTKTAFGEVSALDAEMVQLRTEVAQLRSSAEAERTTFMAAIENKNRELNTEMAEKVIYVTNHINYVLLMQADTTRVNS